MEQRAARAERHALDLIEKRIAEKRMQLELSAGERKKEGELAVKEKAIETAGGVVEKILGGVLGSFGFDAAAAGQLGGLLRLLETDPELAIRLEPVVKAIYAKHDYHEYGGAPLLGVNGTCLISHGSSVARTMMNAILRARQFVLSGMNEVINARLETIQEPAQ